MKKMRSLVLWLALVMVCSVCVANGKISDRRLCADNDCSTIVSMAKTLLNYNPAEPYMVAFRPNQMVRVLSKEAGSNRKVWGIEVNGRRGYGPMSHLEETKVVVSKDKLIEVPTEPYMTPPKYDNKVDEPLFNITAYDNATDSVQTKEQQLGVEDNKIGTETPNEIDAKKTESVEQQQGDDVDPQDAAVEKTIEKSEIESAPEVQKEMREHDDDDDFFVESDDLDAEDENVESDDEEAEEYAGQEPVNEPPAIKKIAYQTGEKDNENLENADIKLEIIGADAKKPDESMLADNNTVAQAGSEEKKSDEPSNTVPDQNVHEGHSDAASSTESISEPQKPQSTEEATDLPPTSDDTKSTSTDENEKNGPAEVNNKNEEATILNVDTEKDVEKPTENEAVPIATSEEPAHSPPLENDKGATELSPAPQPEESTNAKPDSAGVDVDDFHKHIENALNIEKDSNIPPSQPSSSINSPDSASPLNEVHAQPLSGDSRKPEVNLVNEYMGSKDNHEIPPKPVNDPEEFQKPTQALDVVQETSTPIVEESTDAPIIQEEVSPSPDQMNIDVLPVPVAIDAQQTTTPLPILNDAISEDIFTSKPPAVELPFDSSENAETGNWYDGIVAGVFEAYTSALSLFASQPAEKDDSISEHAGKTQAAVDAAEDGYCERLDDGSCPKLPPKSVHIHDHVIDAAFQRVKNINYDEFAKEFLSKVVAMADLVILLALTATAVLIFLFGHYCLANNEKESALISKLNIIEKKLLVSEKECSIVKADLIQTRKQLVSIEDSSFGSNDMVIALKQQLEEGQHEKSELQQQIIGLEKELETAAEAGLELNKMVSELLNNQSGSDSIISSVEELQRQLNEQEATTISINNLLAEKSRENSELQVQLAEKNSKFETEIEELLKLNDVLKMEKEGVEGELREKVHSLETQLNRELESKASELTKLSKEYADLRASFESISAKCQLSTARADALEDTLKKLKQIDGKADLKTVIEATDANAKLLALSRENESLKEKLEGENDARHLLEDHVKVINDEIARLRAEYNQAEKDKLEAQTRLEVLSNYFKEKETQLQKELSVKEALFMKQQGESTSTVERIRNLQDEIQELKSQNDQLRAEIDAQSAAHKAQINAAESRAHDSWLAAKQAERRFEEIRSEAAILRRKLTSLSSNPASVDNSLQNHLINGDGLIPNDHNAPSPIHMESPGSPLMNLVPPNTAPFLPPPPFIGAPMSLPFMPPPPLVPIPPGEMRPPPLGRLMSPPPPPPPLHPSNRFQPNNFVDDRGRYDSRFSPNSRYDDYPNVSTYETETDFSPPRSPEPRSYYRDRDDYDDEDDDYSPRPSPPPVDNRKRKSLNKGGMSSGSIDSSTSRKSRGGTSKN